MDRLLSKRLGTGNYVSGGQYLDMVSDHERWKLASEVRAAGGLRCFCDDSPYLEFEHDGGAGRVFVPGIEEGKEEGKVDSEVEALISSLADMDLYSGEVLAVLRRLPMDAVTALREHAAFPDHVVDIVLDLHRVPEVSFLRDDRKFYDLLGHSPVTRDQLDTALHGLTFDGRNRAGLSDTLHRISRIPGTDDSTVGLTVRIGRPVAGAAAPLYSLLLDPANAHKSVLLLGPPGRGKTTVLRDVARVLAEERRVIVVDTSNEIGGDGPVAHPSLGRARRMPVAKRALDEVMLEAVQNHTPEELVVDELGGQKAALAAQTVSRRGVRLVATGHANTLADLVHDTHLTALTGRAHAVIFSDAVARERQLQTKTLRERTAEPVFGVVVELRARSDWVVYTDATAAVDGVLGKKEVRGLRVVSRVTADGLVEVAEQQVVALDSRGNPAPLGDADELF